MTLHEFPDVVQGSEEWHTLRRGMVTASAVGQLVTAKTLKPANNDVSRGVTALIAAERITGCTEENFVSSDMWRGLEDEPVARDLYSKYYAEAREYGFMYLERDGWKLGFSPDGVVGDDGLIEIKSRRPKIQLLTILSDEVPASNMAQLQTGLFVSGRKWIDYISFSGGMPLYVKRVRPDPRWFDAIIAATELCEKAVTEMIARYEVAILGRVMTERRIEQEMVIS